MPDDEQEPAREPDRNVQAVRVFTGYGIASAVLGVVAVAVQRIASMLPCDDRRRHCGDRRRRPLLLGDIGRT